MKLNESLIKHFSEVRVDGKRSLNRRIGNYAYSTQKFNTRETLVLPLFLYVFYMELSNTMT